MADQAHELMALKEEIRRLLADVLDDPKDVDSLSDETNLTDSGLINSVKFMKFVNRLESEFGIRFKIEDISVGSFSSIDSTSRIVNSYKIEKGVQHGI